MESSTETSIMVIRARAQVELCKRISIAALASNDVRKWIDVLSDLITWRHRPFPSRFLPLAVMCRADLSTIRHLYEINPPPPDPEKKDDFYHFYEDMASACQYGAEPGVFQYLSDKYPKLRNILRPEMERCSKKASEEAGGNTATTTTKNEDKKDATMQSVKAQIDLCKNIAHLSTLSVLFLKRIDFLDQKKLLKFALICRPDLGAIQSLYGEWGECTELDAEYILFLACESGSQKGVIPYLGDQFRFILCKKENGICAHAIRILAKLESNRRNPGDISTLARLHPEAVRHELENPDHLPFPRYLIAIAMIEGVDERDIRTLVELWPECVVKSMYFSRDDHVVATPLQMCYILENYNRNSDLKDFMIQCLPDKIDNFDFYFTDGLGPDDEQELYPNDENDLAWIESVFQRCQGKIDSGEAAWRGPGLHKYLGLCFCHDIRMKEMCLQLPLTLDESPRDEEGGEDSSKEGIDGVPLAMEQFEKTYSTSLTTQKYPRIEHLILMFDHPAYFRLVDLLSHWPCLHKLELYFGDLVDLPMDAISRLLQNGRLEHLVLSVETQAISATNKRKAPSEEAYRPLQPLLNALATNETLVSLEIDVNDTPEEEEGGGGEEEEEDCCVEASDCDLLVQALKQNTTLERVDGFSPENESQYNKEQQQLDYYLTLNQCGRKVVRDDSTTLEGFVNVLALIGSNVRDKRDPDQKGYEYNYRNAMYGLLQEGISKWS